MSEIQHSTSFGPLSVTDAAVRLRNAPAWVIASVNRERQLRGLATIPTRTTAAAPVRRKPAPAKSALAARLPAAPARRSPLSAPAPLPRIGFVLTPGVGTIPGGREMFEPGAWDAWFRLLKRDRSSRKFEIRCLGHDGPVVAALPDSSINFWLAKDVGPVCVWQPDASKPLHRSLVTQIAAGADAVSAEFHATMATLSRGVRRIQMAGPVGVAILRRSQEPAYSGALCGVIDDKRPIHLEIRRLVDKAMARAAGK